MLFPQQPPDVTEGRMKSSWSRLLVIGQCVSTCTGHCNQEPRVCLLTRRRILDLCCVDQRPFQNICDELDGHDTKCTGNFDLRCTDPP